MQQLIQYIFTDHGFIESGHQENAFFFEKENDLNNEYYLIHYINKEALTGYFESDSVANIFALFDKKQTERGDVEKNTSLILCIKVDSIKDDMSNIRNEILTIEENDYWFKKYTIIYTESSVLEVVATDNSTQKITNLLLDHEAFREYKEDIYKNEQYFLAIQLFIKLPFLIVPKHDQLNYRSIEEFIQDELTVEENAFKNRLRSLDDIYEPSYWENFRSACVDPIEGEQIIQNFIEKFRIDA